MLVFRHYASLPLGDLTGCLQVFCLLRVLTTSSAMLLQYMCYVNHKRLVPPTFPPSLSSFHLPLLSPEASLPIYTLPFPFPSPNKTPPHELCCMMVSPLSPTGSRWNPDWPPTSLGSRISCWFSIYLLGRSQQTRAYLCICIKWMWLSSRQSGSKDPGWLSSSHPQWYLYKQEVLSLSPKTPFVLNPILSPMPVIPASCNPN